MSHTHRLAGQRWFALAFVAALGLAGCGDDDSDDGNDGDPDSNPGTIADAAVGDAQPGSDGSVDPDGATNPDAGPQPDAAVQPTTVTSVGIGFGVACASLSSGQVRCWGANEQGQVGIGSVVPGDVLTPSTVLGLDDAESVDCGTAHCCAYTRGLGSQCWGWNNAGELGSNDPALSNRPAPGVVYETGLPAPINLGGARQIAVGGAHNCAIKGTEVWCWGWNAAGQGGQPAGTGGGELHAAHQVASVTDARTVALAHSFLAEHSCAIQNSGRVMCWGLNNEGQLGSGNANNGPNPEARQVVNLINVTSLALGQRHACAIGEAEDAPELPPAVYCWGSNANGQSGTNANSPQTRPVAVSGIEGAIAVTAGQQHTCAVIEGGGVKCWGDNEFGQLGDGTTFDTRNPVDVLGPDGTDRLTGIAEVAGGVRNTCARTDNEVYCWGSNSRGALGQGTAGGADALRPVVVPVIPEE